MFIDNAENKIPENIVSHLQGTDLNVISRGKTSKRFIDQKCTPDVLMTIAQCILDVINNERLPFDDQDNKYLFSNNVIWKSKSFEESLDFFNKPNPDNPKVASEYDKFIGQITSLLEYAGVIVQITDKDKLIAIKSSGYTINLRQHWFTVEHKDTLNFIALSDRNALNFMVFYIHEVLSQSSELEKFETFFSHPTSNTYETLKTQFYYFLKNNTRLSSSNQTESNRIFTKVINPLAFVQKSKGTKSGRLSSDSIMYSDLLYNHLNFRDVASGKPKNIPRSELSTDRTPISSAGAVAKVKKAIKSLHQSKGLISSEVSINAFPVTNTHELVGHHIFPHATYPQYADAPENIILIDSNQHNILAHNGNNFNTIDLTFQKQCLLSKLDTILKPELSNYYSVDSFVEMIVNVASFKLSKVPNFSFDKEISLLKEEVVSFINEIY